MTSTKFQYADDIALTHQSKDLTEGEKVLSDDLDILNTYFYKKRLNPNPTKTETCAFHLHNMQANKELKVQFEDMTIRHNTSPKYLRMTLDRTLSYKKHLETTKMKVRSRINLLQKLAGTGWGSNGQNLRIAAMALVYSTAEYFAPE